MQKPPIVILAAGSSSRMFPLNTNRHKGEIPLMGSSLISHTIHNFCEKEYREFYIVVSPSCDQTQLEAEITQRSPQAELTFAVLPEATGMGDAVLQVQNHLSGQFGVVTPYYVNGVDFIEKLVALDTTAAVCTTTTETPWRYGIATIEGQRATAITEKPEKGSESSNQRVLACYLLDEEFVSLLRNEKPDHYSFESALNKQMSSGSVGVVQLPSAPTSLKYPWHLFDIFEELLKDAVSSTAADADVAPTAILDDSQGPIIIDSGARIGHTAKVVGPCYIGRQALVGDFSFVRGSSIEMGATIGANTEVVRSILLEKSSIHFGYLADSILGAETKIGGGFVAANKRLDRNEITVEYSNKKILSQRKALGVITGPQVNIGIQSGTMPGVLLGAQTTVYPGSIVYDSTEENSTIKSDHE